MKELELSSWWLGNNQRSDGEGALCIWGPETGVLMASTRPSPPTLVKMPLGDLLGGENPTTFFPWFLLATLAPPRKISFLPPELGKRLLVRNLGGRRSFRWVSLACCCAQPPDLAFITELQRVSGSTWPQSFVAMTTCLLGSVMIFFSFFSSKRENIPTKPEQIRPYSPSLALQPGKAWLPIRAAGGTLVGLQLGDPPWLTGCSAGPPPHSPALLFLSPHSWTPVWGHLRPPFPQMTLQPTLNRHTVNSPNTKGSLLPPREGMGVLACSQRRAALNRVSSPLLQIRLFFFLNLIFRRVGRSMEVGQGPCSELLLTVAHVMCGPLPCVCVT